MSQETQQKCACCFRAPIHNTELPDWIRFVGRAGVIFFCPEHKGYLDTLIRTPKGEIIYTYRGGVEKGANYAWRDGYSATLKGGGVLYPWMTRRECQSDAKRFGCRAVFTESYSEVF